MKQYEDKGIFVGKNHRDYIRKVREAAMLSGEGLMNLQTRLRGIAADNTWAKRAKIMIKMVERKEAALKENIIGKDIPNV